MRSKTDTNQEWSPRCNDSAQVVQKYPLRIEILCLRIFTNTKHNSLPCTYFYTYVFYWMCVGLVGWEGGLITTHTPPFHITSLSTYISLMASLIIIPHLKIYLLLETHFKRCTKCMYVGAYMLCRYPMYFMNIHSFSRTEQKEQRSYKTYITTHIQLCFFCVALCTRFVSWKHTTFSLLAMIIKIFLRLYCMKDVLLASPLFLKK